MKRYVYILSLIFACMVLAGCASFFDTSGVTVELKQTMYLTPTTTVEVTMPLNLSALKMGVERKNIPENGKFLIEVEIENKDLLDYENPQIYFTKTSDTIEYAFLYSPSGKPFASVGDNLYSFGSNFIAKQTNRMLLVGKVGAISDDIVETHFTIGVHDEDGQLLSAHREYTMRVCKEGYC